MVNRTVGICPSTDRTARMSGIGVVSELADLSMCWSCSQCPSIRVRRVFVVDVTNVPLVRIFLLPTSGPTWASCSANCAPLFERCVLMDLLFFCLFVNFIILILFALSFENKSNFFVVVTF